MKSNIWTTSFAIFTMFFGAGNMILPLLLTQTWQQDWALSMLGFCITAVLITLLGLIGGVFAGNTKKFFSPMGVVLGTLLQIILICIEGPFGIIPRCFIVAFGGIDAWMNLGSKYSILFYAICACVVYSAAINTKNNMVSIIGNYMTPLMLISLVLVVVITAFQNIYSTSIPITLPETFKLEPVMDGLTKGYLTYDLPGAIYFTTIAIGYLKLMGNDKESLIKNGIKASLVSAGLLTIVYAAFFYLGTSYGPKIQGLQVEQILPNIVKSSCGSAISIVFSFFIVVACLTTAVAATTIWTDFIHVYLERFNITRKKILIVSLLIAVAVSQLQINGLINMLSPVLNLIYPVLIALTIYNIYIGFCAKPVTE